MEIHILLLLKKIVIERKWSRKCSNYNGMVERISYKYYHKKRTSSQENVLTTRLVTERCMESINYVCCSGRLCIRAVQGAYFRCVIIIKMIIMIINKIITINSNDSNINNNNNKASCN